MEMYENRIESVPEMRSVLDFKSWLIRYRKRGSRRGDLAYDVYLDSRFPNSSDKSILLHYLKRVRNAHPDAISAFLEAYRGYHSYLRTHYDKKLIKENEHLTSEVERLKAQVRDQLGVDKR